MVSKLSLCHITLRPLSRVCSPFFFFNDTATTEIYTLSLHDALPICTRTTSAPPCDSATRNPRSTSRPRRSEEHTSELQSPCNLVCRLLLEKKNTTVSKRPRRPDSA